MLDVKEGVINLLGENGIDQAINFTHIVEYISKTKAKIFK